MSEPGCDYGDIGLQRLLDSFIDRLKPIRPLDLDATDADCVLRAQTVAHIDYVINHCNYISRSIDPDQWEFNRNNHYDDKEEEENEHQATPKGKAMAQSNNSDDDDSDGEEPTSRNGVQSDGSHGQSGSPTPEPGSPTPEPGPQPTVRIIVVYPEWSYIFRMHIFSPTLALRSRYVLPLLICDQTAHIRTHISSLYQQWGFASRKSRLISISLLYLQPTS